MKVSKNHIVKVAYALKNTQGQLLDSRNEKAPLVYLHGQGHIITGLEEALEGRAIDESFTVTIPPERAYGDVDPGSIQVVPKESFSDVEDLSPGMQFKVNTPAGEVVAVLTEVLESEVVIDGNHPLAGETLNFEIKVLSVRPATQEELADKQVHD